MGCTGPSESFTITVNPTAQVNDPADQAVCNGAPVGAVNFATNRTGGATTYAWTNSNPGMGLGAGGVGNIPSFNAINIGNSPVLAIITVTPTFTNNSVACSGPPQSFTITVNPTPALSSTLTPAAVCSNTVFSYPPTSATAGTTFNWTRAVVPGISPAGPASGVNNPNETLVNITSAPINVTYVYTLLANSCSNIQNVIVSIKPEPVISVQSTTVCSGNPMNYRILLDNFNNPADNVTFTWPAPSLSAGITGGSARASASAANITDTFTNTSGGIGTATYTITPFKDGCAGTPRDIVVSVGSEPVLDPGLNNTVCSNIPTGLLLREAAGSVVPTYYNIISRSIDAGLTPAGGNAVVPNATAPAGYLSSDIFANLTGVNKNVTYRVQPVLAPDCFGDPADIIITVRPQPVIVPGQTQNRLFRCGDRQRDLPASGKYSGRYAVQLACACYVRCLRTGNGRCKCGCGSCRNAPHQRYNKQLFPGTHNCNLYDYTGQSAWMRRNTCPGGHNDQPGACSPAYLRPGGSLRGR